jgi:hypothetical protein
MLGCQMLMCVRILYNILRVMLRAPAVPCTCTAILAGGAHNIPVAHHVILVRGYIRALPLRGREEGGNWMHERKSEKPDKRTRVS